SGMGLGVRAPVDLPGHRHRGARRGRPRRAARAPPDRRSRAAPPARARVLARQHDAGDAGPVRRQFRAALLLRGAPRVFGRESRISADALAADHCRRRAVQRRARRSLRLTLVGGGGLALASVGLLLLTRLDAHSTIEQIVGCLVLIGLGQGMFQSPDARAVMNAAPAGEQGEASALLATARVLGPSLSGALAPPIFTGLG